MTPADVIQMNRLETFLDDNPHASVQMERGAVDPRLWFVTIIRGRCHYIGNGSSIADAAKDALWRASS